MRNIRTGHKEIGRYVPQSDENGTKLKAKTTALTFHSTVFTGKIGHIGITGTI